MLLGRDSADLTPLMLEPAIQLFWEEEGGTSVKGLPKIDHVLTFQGFMNSNVLTRQFKFKMLIENKMLPSPLGVTRFLFLFEVVKWDFIFVHRINQIRL